MKLSEIFFTCVKSSGIFISIFFFCCPSGCTLSSCSVKWVLQKQTLTDRKADNYYFFLSCQNFFSLNFTHETENVATSKRLSWQVIKTGTRTKKKTKFSLHCENLVYKSNLFWECMCVKMEFVEKIVFQKIDKQILGISVKHEYWHMPEVIHVRNRWLCFHHRFIR